MSKEKQNKPANEIKKVLTEAKEVPREELLALQGGITITAPKEDNQATKDLITVIAATSKGYELSDDVAKREIERRVKVKLEVAEASKAATGVDIAKAKAFFDDIKKRA